MKTLTLSETAKRLGFKDPSVRDKRVRVRLGLPAVKVGGRLMFLESDVERVLRRGREKLPAKGEGCEV
jgi:Helix-turn-helix domain